MRKLTSLALILALVALTVMGFADDAAAQRRGGRSGTSSAPPPSSSEYKDGIDISASYGWMWGGNMELYSVPTPNGLQSGTVRWASNPSYMFAVEVPVRPGMQLQLQYTGQPSQLNWDSVSGLQKVADMSVNYWQIGTVAGMPKGRVLPYVMFTLGATYWSFSNFTGVFTANPENMTKFSFTAGVGAKTFFGENQKVGVRLQFRVLPTFYNTFATVGTGGVGVSGNAVWQWEIGGGLVIKFGK